MEDISAVKSNKVNSAGVRKVRGKSVQDISRWRHVIGPLAMRHQCSGESHLTWWQVGPGPFWAFGVVREQATFGAKVMH